MKIITLANGDLVTIKQKPWWLFWLGSNFTITLSPYVYTTDSIYANEDMDVLVHENVHLHQQAEMGKWKFYLKYIFSRDFRYQVEFDAYLTEFKWCVDHDRAFDISFVSSMLSSFGYLWCVSGRKATADFIAAMKTYIRQPTP